MVSPWFPRETSGFRVAKRGEEESSATRLTSASAGASDSSRLHRAMESAFPRPGYRKVDEEERQETLDVLRLQHFRAMFSPEGDMPRPGSERWKWKKRR